jgi:hypothetical protein
LGPLFVDGSGGFCSVASPIGEEGMDSQLDLVASVARDLPVQKLGIDSLKVSIFGACAPLLEPSSSG